MDSLAQAAREVRARDGAYGASGTSFYTTTEKQETYDSLDTVLDAKCRDTQVCESVNGVTHRNYHIQKENRQVDSALAPGQRSGLIGG